jgi:uncharacterized protein with PIN domain
MGHKTLLRKSEKKMSTCPKCKKECEEVTVDHECEGTVLRNVKALRCPDCKEELFTLEQYDAIRDRLRHVLQPLKLGEK